MSTPGGTYWLRVTPELWAERDTLRWPEGVTPTGHTMGERMSTVLVQVHDAGAPAGLEDHEIEWSVCRPVSHELLVDSGGHVCGPDCPLPEPPYVPAPVSIGVRLRRRARRAWWAVRRVPGLRLVHRDRADRDCDC